MFKKLWAFLTKQKLVVLRDQDGELTTTFAFNTPFGLHAKRFWPYGIITVKLLDGGTTENNSIVKEWRWMDGTTKLPSKGDSK